MSDTVKKELLLVELEGISESDLEECVEKILALLSLYKYKCIGVSRVTDHKIEPPEGPTRVISMA